MKTEVIMKREIFGQEISQKSQSEYFSATELVRAGNIWRLQSGGAIFNFYKWLEKESTKEFIGHLEEEIQKKAIIKSLKKGGSVWIHPFVFIDLALAISPTLKVQVYQWLYDYLLHYRNDSGDSYKKMTGGLYLNDKSKTQFYKKIKEVAKKIKSACNVKDWQKATEEQLKLRDTIYNNIALLCDVLRDNEKAVSLGIEKAIKE